MAESKYVGPAAAASDDLGTLSVVDAAKTADISALSIDAQITNGLAGYALASYADTRDALNATQAYVDAGDATKLKLAQKDVANGIAALDATGRVNRSLIDATSTQRFPAGLWTPSAYGAETITQTEATVFTTAVTDPGYPYRIAVQGALNGIGSSGQAPTIKIRVGSPSGPVIASGSGSTITSPDIDDFNRTGATLGSGWAETWTGAGTGHAETNGTSAVYIPNGSGYDRTGIFQRLGRGGVHQGANVEITWTNTSDTVSATNGPIFTVYARMSANRSDWVGVNFTADNYFVWTWWPWYGYSVVPSFQFAYSAAGTLGTIGSSVACQITTNDTFRFLVGVGGNDRRLQLYRNGTLLGDAVDTTSSSPIGARGWGFGYRAGTNGTTQLAPPSVGTISASTAFANDITFPPIPVLPQSMSTQVPSTGAKTLYIQLVNPIGAGGVAVGDVDTSALAIQAIPA